MLSLYQYKSQYIARRTRLLSGFGHNRSLFHGPNGTPLWMKQFIAVADGLQSAPGVGHHGGRSLRKVSTSLHHIASKDNFQSIARKDDDITRVIPEKEHRILSTFSKMCSDTPGEGTYCIYAAVLTPYGSLEIWFSFDPCMWGKIWKCHTSTPLIY